MPTARADPLAAAGGLVATLLSVALLRFRCSLLGRQPRFGLGSLVTSSRLGRGTGLGLPRRGGRPHVVPVALVRRGGRPPGRRRAVAPPAGGASPRGAPGDLVPA